MQAWLVLLALVLVGTGCTSPSNSPKAAKGLPAFKAPEADRDASELQASDDKNKDKDNGNDETPVAPMPSSDSGNDDQDTDGGKTDSDDELTIEDESAVRPAKPLIINGLRRDDGDAGITVKVTNSHGKTFTGTWPGTGEMITIEGVCDAAEVALDVVVSYEGRESNVANNICFIGKRLKEGTLQMAVEDTEDGCDEDLDDYDEIDDAIAQFDCDKTKLSFKGLRMNDAIDTDKWLN